MYDIIGDIHGCYTELKQLMEKLGYSTGASDISPIVYPYAHPQGRQAVFVGDLCDRGPDSPSVIALVRRMVKEGTGICVMGNHDDKLMRYLEGNGVKIGRSLAKTIEQMDNKDSPLSRKQILKFLQKLPYKILLDQGKLLVCHAGLKEKYHLSEVDKVIRAKCIYGETTGQMDANGYPVRLPWQKDYHGERIVVHGHTALTEVLIENKVYNVDTGAVFGGKLTALRYPEMELVSQLAHAKYWDRREH